MLKYLTHKLRTQSINEEIVHEKIDGHDSGTESDGDLISEDELNVNDMDLSMNSRQGISPTNTASSFESPAFVSISGCSTASGDSELTAINSPTKYTHHITFIDSSRHNSDQTIIPHCTKSNNNNNYLHRSHSISKQNNQLMYDQHSSEEELEVINGPSSDEKTLERNHEDEDEEEQEQDDVEDEYRDVGEDDGQIAYNESTVQISSSSTLMEKRKRSLAQSSDDEVRNLLEHVPAPVNFRTSPPIEALKPHHGHHMFGGHQRSITPLVLADSVGRGIESIRISCDSGGSNYGTCSVSPLVVDTSARSVSPPAKLFHCDVSPRRRPPRHNSQHHRLQRSHRPCLDFDKMQQQLKARSVTAWRHSNEHSGELSVFCW